MTMREETQAEDRLRNRPKAQECFRAFTLIELLVVIAIIGILASLLLPSLTAAKNQARSTMCLNNLKQLEVCWHLYALDNKDVLPPNNFVYDIISDTPIDQGGSWCTNLAPFESDPSGIANAMLFPYNQQLSIYHCPADKSTVEPYDGNTNGVGRTRLRSYNMSMSINGWPEYDPFQASYTPSFKRFTEIINPSPTKLITFLDVHEDEILDTMFGIPTQLNWSGQNVWWDVPANRHNQGCNFSFADGHVEHWKWKVPKVVSVPRGFVQPVLPEEMDDYNRMEAGFRQNFD